MEPSTEILQLLREIRDAQRESLAVTKAWKERSDQQYREQAEDIVQWREGNKRYVEQTENWLLQQRFGKRATITSLAIMFLGATALVTLAAAVLLK